jgi:ribokinase
MIGAVGEDAAGHRIVQALYEDRVDTEHILRCRNEETGRASIALGKNGENNVIVCPGANYKLTSDQIRVDLREGSPHLLILQMEIPVQTVKDLIKKAAEERIPVLLNAAPVMDGFPRDILRSVEHLIVNKLEAEDLLDRRQTTSNASGQRPEQEENREAEIATGTNLCKSLLEFGMKYAVVTMGGHGGVAGWRGQDGQPHIFDYKAEEVDKVVDTTGCGGVFIGAYAVQYIRQKFSPGGGFDIARAVTWAARAAAVKAESIGSLDGIPWEDELDAA